MKQQKFTHKQWVLVRDSIDGVWASAQFSNMWNNLFIVVGGFAWNYCIPYSGNEHLLGTSDDYEETYIPKDGDFVVSGWEEDNRYCHWLAIVRGDDNESDFYNTYAIYINRYTKDAIGEAEATVNLENSYCDSQKYVRPATEEERQLLLSKLAELGKHWNPEKKCIEDVYTPKDGDFVYSDDGDYIFIYNANGSSKTSFYIGGSLSSNDFKISDENNDYAACGNHIEYYRPATETQKQQLLEALHKEGKDWDPEKKEIVEYQWIPQAGVNYHTICFEKQRGGFFPSPTWWSGTSSDEYNKKNGWIFRDKDSAQKKADELNNKLLKGE